MATAPFSLWEERRSRLTCVETRAGAVYQRFFSGTQDPQLEVAELQDLEDVGEGELRCLLVSGGDDRERVLMDVSPRLLI